MNNRLILSMPFLCLFVSLGMAQDSTKKKTKKPKKAAQFSWVSPLSEKGAKYLPSGIKHATFTSPSMGLEVGYYIYLPPQYESSPERRFPVVYHLHGGRPGGESKSVKIAKYIDKAVQTGAIKPTIYVFPNGGPMSWYNYPQIKNGQGEDVFVQETVPHIDQTYRTIAKRSGRGIQGFSQGGRGTTRIMFKHPEMWGSTAPGGSGYAPEKRIQENNGAESENVIFTPGYNTWDLAKSYLEAKSEASPLFPLIWVGDKGFNYEFNLKFSDYLEELGIPHQMLVVPGAEHSATQIYEARGRELLQFHDDNFSKNGQ